MRFKVKKRRFEEVTVPLTAMIDVLFMLIIFFIVTAAIDKEIHDDEVRLANSPNSKPVTKKEPKTFTINIRNDGSVNTGMLPLTMNEIREQLISAADKWGPDTVVVIRADKDVKHWYVEKVLAMVTDAKLHKIKFNAVVQ
jgi:biopolymer transport protein ExbD